MQNSFINCECLLLNGSTSLVDIALAAAIVLMFGHDGVIPLVSGQLVLFNADSPATQILPVQSPGIISQLSINRLVWTYRSIVAPKQPRCGIQADCRML